MLVTALVHEWRLVLILGLVLICVAFRIIWWLLDDLG
jgi:hypothetical protein